MKPTVLLGSFSLPLLAIGCSVPKYQTTFRAYRQAVVRGELNEALASYEAQAREAEKSAQASLFPQQYWRAAVDAYRQAARRSPGSWTITESNHIWRKGSRDGGEVKRSRQPV